MSSPLSAPRARTLNAKVGAITLAAGAFLTLFLSHFAASLTPLRLLAVTVSAFAAWCFCDEMGLQKPLNRAGFVFFAIAVASKVELLLGVEERVIGRYNLLFAAFLLAALLMWSVALLHRQKTPKVVGAVGVLASAAPIVALVVGHVVVGAGAALGMQALFTATHGAGPTDYSFVTLVERLFGMWCYAVAWLLWRGQIQASPVRT
jgi:hypothetical protein